MSAPPSEVMLPPDEAPMSVMLLAFVVVKTGKFGKVGLFSDSSLEHENNRKKTDKKNSFFIRIEINMFYSKLYN